MGGTSLPKHLPEEWLYLAFAFVGGYGDAVSFVLAKTFTGHITGSLVLAAIAIAAHAWSSLAVHLSAVLFFLIGVFASVRIERALAAWQRVKSPSAFLIIEAFLTLAAYLALAAHAATGAEVFVVCMSLALGIQNGAFQSTGGISVHTTYLTGMITGLVTSEARRQSRQHETPSRISSTESGLRLLVVELSAPVSLYISKTRAFLELPCSCWRSLPVRPERESHYLKADDCCVSETQGIEDGMQSDGLVGGIRLRPDGVS